jgi:O-antigen chain-terminating methyltransferase
MTPEQIAATVKEIRERALGRRQKKVPEVADFELPSLDDLGYARDAAESHVASIGRVNPRPPGLANKVAQTFKKVVARLLDWHIRDQVDFNRAAVRYMDTALEIEAEQNYNLLRVARSLAELGQVQEERYHELKGLLESVAQQQQDILKHWNQWRPTWEEKLTASEISLLHSMREMEAGARDRQESFRARLEQMHEQYGEALAETANQHNDALADTTKEIQERLWRDLKKLRSEQEDLIHTELKLIRRRAGGALPKRPVSKPQEAATSSGFTPLDGFDYARFEERFRGREDYVARSQEFYLPRFQDCRRVVDLGCGRGEFLELMRKQGIDAQGVDLDADAVAACHEKGLSVTQSDLFGFLDAQPEASLDGILCSHVVEHLQPARLIQLVSAAAGKLAAGGVLAIETPNPACLATLTGDFFLDPTHVRPVPASLLHFLFEEAGLSSIEVHDLRAASEAIPEIMALDRVEGGKAFREKFFGGLDYAIVGQARVS